MKILKKVSILTISNNTCNQLIILCKNCKILPIIKHDCRNIQQNYV